ncbi:MAG: hypothetical protein CMJ19_14685 [Phycisphaeraceae bacterium]|nr:hypothetical protein [Phycisphaeraceae bacterium]
MSQHALPQEQTDHWTLGFYALPQAQRQSLQLTRDALAKGSADLQQAVDCLTAIAQSKLDEPLPSVVDDPITPPSGDHHDYTSLGTYWWPNPDTDDGLPYIRRDGQRNPQTLGADFTALCDVVELITIQILAWRLTDQTPFAQKAIDALRHFFLDPQSAMNPHLKYAQRIPGHCDGRGIGLIDTHRLIPVTELLPLLRDSELWQNEDEQGMQLWFTRYLDWFEQSDLGQTERNEHNNHGTWHDAQVVAFALYTNQSQRALQVLEQVAPKRIDQHLASDGSQPHEEARTLSLTYSIFNLEAMLAMTIWGQTLGIDLWEHVGPNGQTLNTAVDYLTAYQDCIDTWPKEQIKPASPTKLAALTAIRSHIQGTHTDAAIYKQAFNSLPISHRLFSLIYPPQID